MPKTKYKFDYETLSYNKINHTFWQKVWIGLKQTIALVIISVIVLFIFSVIFDTPNERQMKRENQQLVLQYELLNKKLNKMELAMDDIKHRDDHIYRLIFGADPIPSSVRDAGFGGVNRYKELEGYSNSELVIETSKKLDKLLKQLYIQSKSYDDVLNLALEKEVFLASVPAISPIADRDLTRFASGYGYRIHPIYRTRKMHTGIDLTAPTGTPVYVTGNGRVIKAGYTPGGYGKRVLVDHGFGFKTLYAHLNEIDVKVGQIVKRGDIIGKVGNTGRSTAPHLHYEVRKNNKTENPVNYYYNDLTPEQYDEIIKISSQMNMSFD